MKQLTIQDWGLCIGRKVVDCNEVGTLLGICDDGLLIDFSGESDWSSFPWGYKPILRTIDQMTEEEWDDLESIQAIDDDDFFFSCACAIDYLTRIGIDIRGWINEGLAVKYDPGKHGEWV